LHHNIKQFLRFYAKRAGKALVIRSTLLQHAYKTPLPAFELLSKHPTNLTYSNDYMALQRVPEFSWLTVCPVKDVLNASGWTDQSTTKAIYVNIGGGIGHQCAQFKGKYPDLTGRVVLQDLEQSIDKALSTPGVENMVHNSFDEQPIKGK
jgi:hypothetical protein